MRWELFLSSLALIAVTTADAHADIVATPRFSAQETQTIARNELLRDIVQADPWLVRHMLDLISRRAKPGRAQGLGEATNPDLAVTPRDPQGVVEWNALIKRAKAEKAQRAKAIEPGSTRSSEGSVEMLDMMRRAKARKDAAATQ